ncbi:MULTISPECIES: hypothetical protein [unclassified Mariprofundus]|uniref:hypothetical protein n=1 Tax=unclassified Mariprofundus TaxID=2619007 RepID=UPI0015A1ADC4|nr:MULTISPECIES: hypothetical protein [unclassified Mariprofundus]NWF35336.1 hypothetical protein [Mariprofundus sp. KV]NWF38451.1 hypothetical protein [Mariprofundus sp. NF]
MTKRNEIIIDLDQICSDPEVLAKLHECASLMVQSSNSQEVKSGYQMLEMVDQCMRQQEKKGE